MSATVEELEALPEGAVVMDCGSEIWEKVGGFWELAESVLELPSHSSYLHQKRRPITILHPQPEPDHSMCARLAWDGDSWTLRHPNGVHVISFSADQARDRGYPIPDTRTVEERVVDVLLELDVDDDLLDSMAARLAELGLLAKDGERNE